MNGKVTSACGCVCVSVRACVQYMFSCAHTQILSPSAFTYVLPVSLSSGSDAICVCVCVSSFHLLQPLTSNLNFYRNLPGSSIECVFYDTVSPTLTIVEHVWTLNCAKIPVEAVVQPLRSSDGGLYIRVFLTMVSIP